MSFSSKLLLWYNKNKRDLPWRNTSDPYKIWISEIILQQTRVEQGLPYYVRFIQKFPTIKHLALAKEDEILRLWQGLGYYTRARNLHAAAKTILVDHRGVFPKTFEEIKKLKGIGDYTASAIASIAFDLPHATIDGNAVRVLSRLFMLKENFNSANGKKKFKDFANELLDKKNPASFNQALMELGATICKPKNPDCHQCPVIIHCLAYERKLQHKFPLKKKKVSVKNRYFNYAVIKNRNKLLLTRRTGNDIWKNMYDFPLIEAERLLPEKLFKKALEKKFETASVQIKGYSNVYEHKLSHQTIYARFFFTALHPKSQKTDGYHSKEQMDKIALPRLIHRFIEENNWDN